MLFIVLSPFAVFAVLTIVASTPISLLAAGSLSVALLIADRVRGRSLKWLQFTAAAVFLSLGLYVTLVDRQFGVDKIRAIIDGAMLMVGIVSLLLRAPFTLQYARESVTAEIAELPEFRRINYLITTVWTLACVAMLAGNFISMMVPWLPLWTGIATAFVARSAAAAFTQWYSGLRRDRMIAGNAILPSS